MSKKTPRLRLKFSVRNCINKFHFLRPTLSLVEKKVSEYQKVSQTREQFYWIRIKVFRNSDENQKCNFAIL